MKSILTLAIALSTVGAMANNKPLTENYKVDSAATKVNWVAEKKLGAGHNGGVSVKNGAITVQGDLITAGEVVVDMNTITVADIPATDEYNGKLVGHLKAPDFFDVAKFPEAKFVFKGSEKTKTGLKIKGDLTFIGKTNPIEFDAVVTKTAKAYTAKSNVVIDRTKWGLKYNSENWIKQLAGDKVIKDNFTLAIDITASK